METKKLPLEFIGIGEVSGFKFQQVYSNDNFYVYKVTTPNDAVHFETFKRKVNRGFDFNTKQELDYLSEQYPKSQHFGSWAWCNTNLEIALKKCLHAEVNNE